MRNYNSLFTKPLLMNKPSAPLVVPSLTHNLQNSTTQFFFLYTLGTTTHLYLRHGTHIPKYIFSPFSYMIINRFLVSNILHDLCLKSNLGLIQSQPRFVIYVLIYHPLQVKSGFFSHELCSWTMCRMMIRQSLYLYRLVDKLLY